MLPAHGYVDDTGALLDRLDGLLVSGGPDLDPARLRPGAATRRSAPRSTASPTSTSWRCSPAPPSATCRCSGICRGLQALNVSRGGTLHQHLPDRSELAHLQRHERFAPAHAVDVAHGSLLHWLTGSDGLAVNSFHHQAADRIGAGLEVCARAPDGTVEALWDPAARFCLGVQWHAELMTHRAEQATLLQGLVDAACGLPAQLSPRRLTRAATIWGWPPVATSTPSRSSRFPTRRRLRGVPRERLAVGAPAHVPDLRPDRLLRQLARTATRPRTTRQTGHPIIRSAEPGEDWSWCYEDELMFRLRAHVSPARPDVTVVGRRLDPEDHRLRDFLTRSAQPLRVARGRDPGGAGAARAARRARGASCRC